MTRGTRAGLAAGEAPGAVPEEEAALAADDDEEGAVAVPLLGASTSWVSCFLAFSLSLRFWFSLYKQTQYEHINNSYLTQRCGDKQTLPSSSHPPQRAALRSLLRLAFESSAGEMNSQMMRTVIRVTQHTVPTW